MSEETREQLAASTDRICAEIEKLSDVAPNRVVVQVRVDTV